MVEKGNTEENKTVESCCDKAIDESEMKVAGTGINLPKISLADSLDEIFKDSDFQNSMLDSFKELQAFDM